MYPIFLAADFNPETIADKLSLCGRMILRGMGTVFLVLVILWGIIAIFGAFAKAEAKRERERIMEQVKNSPAPNDLNKPAATTSADSVEEVPEADEGALIAAITAAIEAFRAEEGLAARPYRVVSFRRRPTNKSWNTPADS